MIPVLINEAIPIAAAIKAARVTTASNNWIFPMTTPSDAATCQIGRTIAPEIASSNWCEIEET